jgi:hypothetical protein
MGSSPGRIKTKTQIGICCCSAKYAALRRKSKDWLARNQDNVRVEHHYHLMEWNLFSSMIKLKNCPQDVKQLTTHSLEYTVKLVLIGHPWDQKKLPYKTGDFYDDTRKRWPFNTGDCMGRLDCTMVLLLFQICWQLVMTRDQFFCIP